jgi:2-amino-4-hydroxy-6-hydroxymethyldihydropteridine diphosphokinase
MTRAYVGFGANLGDREATIRSAIAALPDVVAVSELRETDPVGVVDQPAFLNGAVGLDTELAPRDLLDALLAVERAASAGARARSTSTCCSTATRRSTSRA